MAALLPEGLRRIHFRDRPGWAWCRSGWTESRSAGCRRFRGRAAFPELHFRTYVRDQFTGTPGVYCFSLDASNLLAVAVARAYFHLPCNWAEMRLEQRTEREFVFYSRRRFSSRPVIFNARYRGLGPTCRLAENRCGSLEYFFTERYCLYSANRAGQPIRANIHYVSWPLEEAEAEIEQNDLASSIGLELPKMDPVLHYSRRLAVYIWPRELLRSALAARPVTVAVSPSG